MAPADPEGRPALVVRAGWLAARCPAAGGAWQGRRRRRLAGVLADWRAHQRGCPRLGWEQPAPPAGSEARA